MPWHNRLCRQMHRAFINVAAEPADRLYSRMEAVSWWEVAATGLMGGEL